MVVVKLEEKRRELLKEKLEEPIAPFSAITSLSMERAFMESGFLIFVQSVFPPTQFYYNEVDKQSKGEIYFFGKQLFLARAGESNMIVDAYSEIHAIPYIGEKMIRPVKRNPKKRENITPLENHWRPVDELTPTLKNQIESSCLENAIMYCDDKNLMGLGRIIITNDDYQPRIKKSNDFYFPRLVY